MSASSEKKRRQIEREQGTDKSTLAKQEAEARAKKSKRDWTIGTVLIVLLLAAIFVLNSSLPYKLPAAAVEDTTFSVGSMNYFYTNVSNPYTYYGIDISGVKDEETGETWREYFQEQAVENARYLEGLYQKAVSEGFTLSEEGKERVETTMNSLPETAKNYHYSSVKKFLAANYGHGVTENVIREILEKSELVSEYIQSIQDGFTYTEEELSQYFQEHKADYQTYSYLYYTVAAETEETTNEAGETVTTVVEGGLEAAKAAADTIAAAAKDEASFDEAVNAYMEGKTSQVGNNVASSISELYRDWVTDPGRKTGDVTVVGNENGYTVVLFQSTEEQTYPEVAVRHILIKTEDTDGDGSYSQEEMDAALAKIQEVEAEWKAGEQTEEAFAALVEKYSADAGSNTNGGLYEGIYKGQMVEEFNDFCFADGRKTGDTGIVHGSSANYDGYHLIYFVGEGQSHSLTLARNSLVSTAYTEWEEGVLAEVTADTKMGYGLIGK